MNRALSISPLRQAIGLAGWLLLCFAAAGLGGLASVQAGSFYLDLARPGWAPPAWLFGPVWSVLYLLMGVAAWLVWRQKRRVSTRAALTVFVVQLVANALWTWLFFAWHLGALAFAEVLLLWILILTTLLLFRSVNRLAAALLLPYLAWVSFAAALNFSLWQLNPAVLG
ncbi:MAG: TspO/MBR family protein [Burkholderiaceae bacterium]